MSALSLARRRTLHWQELTPGSRSRSGQPAALPTVAASSPPAAEPLSDEPPGLSPAIHPSPARRESAWSLTWLPVRTSSGSAAFARAGAVALAGEGRAAEIGARPSSERSCRCIMTSAFAGSVTASQARLFRSTTNASTPGQPAAHWCNGRQGRAPARTVGSSRGRSTPGARTPINPGAALPIAEQSGRAGGAPALGLDQQPALGGLRGCIHGRRWPARDECFRSRARRARACASATKCNVATPQCLQPASKRRLIGATSAGC